MRHQLFHQNKQDRSEVDLIVEFTAKEDPKEYRQEMNKLMAENPPPDGCEFMVCTPDSEFFEHDAILTEYAATPQR